MMLALGYVLGFVGAIAAVWIGHRLATIDPSFVDEDYDTAGE